MMQIQSVVFYIRKASESYLFKILLFI